MKVIRHLLGYGLTAFALPSLAARALQQKLMLRQEYIQIQEAKLSSFGDDHGGIPEGFIIEQTTRRRQRFGPWRNYGKAPPWSVYISPLPPQRIPKPAIKPPPWPGSALNDLKPHQLAKLSDGSTVLAKAVIEHNLLATSKLYNNIGVEELGVLLGLSGAKAEEYAARMIEQKRLAGRIDQIDKLIYFDVGGLVAPVTQDAASEKDRGGKEGKNTGGQAATVIGKELRK
ncbi:hypothetical protein EV426DRAFT_572792 [Tirmania nivea]|nr:hypothetical protein EV426DRAFT_572792 [Tirmania nivea]